MGSSEEYPSPAWVHHDGGRRQRRLVRCLWLYLALAASGCTGPIAPPPTAPHDPALTSMVDAARADAQRRLPAGSPSPALVSAEIVTWSDGSLGCPEPGRRYTQALVPGWRIRLRSGATAFDYHASLHGALVLCPPGRSVEPRPESRY